jgi:hypothetical protein
MHDWACAENGQLIVLATGADPMYVANFRH